jgi:hypothetical protein
MQNCTALKSNAIGAVSRRCDVAASRRCDVAASRRCDVAASRRNDSVRNLAVEVDLGSWATDRWFIEVSAPIPDWVV